MPAPVLPGISDPQAGALEVGQGRVGAALGRLAGLGDHPPAAGCPGRLDPGGDQRGLRAQVAVIGQDRGAAERGDRAVHEEISAADQISAVPDAVGPEGRVRDRGAEHLAEALGRHTEAAEQHVGPRRRVAGLDRRDPQPCGGGRADLLDGAASSPTASLPAARTRSRSPPSPAAAPTARSGSSRPACPRTGRSRRSGRPAGG